MSTQVCRPQEWTVGGIMTVDRFIAMFGQDTFALWEGVCDLSHIKFVLGEVGNIEADLRRYFLHLVQEKTPHIETLSHLLDTGQHGRFDACLQVWKRSTLLLDAFEKVYPSS